MPRLALICSAHGFGHVTRQLALAEELLARGVVVELFSAAPDELIDESLPRLPRRRWLADVGIAQPDSFHEDLDATAALLQERCGDAAIDRLAAALDGFDGAVVDAAPPALEAARRAGLPCLAVANFDWAWIYGHYPTLRPWAERFAAWQAPHLALHTPPGPALTAFGRVIEVGPIGRASPPVALPGDSRHVLVSFGGLGREGAQDALPRLDGVTWVVAPPQPRPRRDDMLRIDGVPYPALVASVDAVLTKAGYGIFTEASLAGTPLLYVPRRVFPEAPYIERAMDARGDLRLDAEAPFADLESALNTILGRPAPAPAAPGVAAAADAVLRHTQTGPIPAH